MLIRRGLQLHVESGLLSGIDLAADGPATKMMVSVLVFVLEFQRGMVSENTLEGVAVDDGKTSADPPPLPQRRTAMSVTPPKTPELTAPG